MRYTTENLISGSIVFTSLVLTLGYGLGGYWLLALGIVGLGFAWLFGQRRAWRWTAAIGFVVVTGLAALGVWFKLSTLWLLLAIVGALTAWDLADFAQRLGQTTNVHQAPVMSRIHVRRLQIAAGLGLLLGLVALGVQVQLNFGWAVFLALLMVISLSWVVGLIRRSREQQ
jgi:hypothetical protein